MQRFVFLVGVMLGFYVCCSVAQTPSLVSSDSQAVSLAQQSNIALTGSVPVGDVSLSATVISLLDNRDTGSGTLAAKGWGQSRVDLTLGSGVQSEVRNISNGVPFGSWAKNGSPSVRCAQHNSWTDAGWFFPGLSSLTQTNNPNFVFKYVGQEQHGGVNAQHIQVFQSPASSPDIRRLSRMDFYLDSVSLLPLAISFNTHADLDMNVDIPTEVRFANYQAVNGIQVPFHMQRMLNGELILDVTITSVSLNTGLLDGLFTLP